MNTLIEFLNLNREWVRPIWFILGLIGMFFMKKYTRPSFYENKSTFWWFITTTYYMLLGPLIFVVSLLTFINSEKQ
jgi:hypothetical protein